MLPKFNIEFVQIEIQPVDKMNFVMGVGEEKINLIKKKMSNLDFMLYVSKIVQVVLKQNKPRKYMYNVQVI